MTRVVLIGGFGNSTETLEPPAEALLSYYDDVDVFTFPEAIENDQQVELAVRKAPVVVHSEGMLTLYNTRPKNVTAFSAPLPKSRTKLALASVAKTIQLRQRDDLISSREIVRTFNRRTIRELGAIASAQSRVHWRYFLNGAISSFNSISLAQKMRVESGTKTELVYGHDDVYYSPNFDDKSRASEIGVRIREIPDLLHDSLLVDPLGTLQRLYETPVAGYENGNSRVA